jgi:hypothetical protein
VIADGRGGRERVSDQPAVLQRQGRYYDTVDLGDQDIAIKRPSVGYVETVTGPQPICRGHIAGAERAGYTVHRGDQP